MAQDSSKKIAQKVAKRIKELRKQLKITQEEFLYDTGIHIGRLETGEYNIQIDTLYKICKYFKISLLDFFSEGFEN